MKVLIIHNEDKFFGGAETVLINLVSGLQANNGIELTVGVVAGSKLSFALPAQVKQVFLTSNRPLSVIKIFKQIIALKKNAGANGFGLIHAWAARDWELAGLLGKILKKPAIATLHDHPMAWYHSLWRQKMMRFLSSSVLDKTVCVSESQRSECIKAHYNPEKLSVIYNGIPARRSTLVKPGFDEKVRLGFMGTISEGKGFKLLFELIDSVTKVVSVDWTLEIAGDAQDSQGRQLLQWIKNVYSSRSWWDKVNWLGWVDDRIGFFSKIDLLIFPSVSYDCLPTVLLEAGISGVPVFSSKVGGTPEIVIDQKTGWLFDINHIKDASRALGNLMQNKKLLHEAGERAVLHITKNFSVEKMVADYLKLYSNIIGDDK